MQVNPAFTGVRSYYEPHQGYQINPQLRASAPYGAMVQPAPVASQVASSHAYNLHAGQFTDLGPPSADLQPARPPFALSPLDSPMYGKQPCLHWQCHIFFSSP